MPEHMDSTTSLGPTLPSTAQPLGTISKAAWGGAITYLSIGLIMAIASPIATFVLMHSLRWKRAVNYTMLLMIVSLMDLIISLYVLLPGWIDAVSGVQFSNTLTYLCRTMEPIGHICVTNSMGLLVMISVERYLYVNKSYLYIKVVNHRTIDRYALVIIGIDGGILFAQMLSYEMNAKGECTTTDLILFSTYLWFILTAFIPFVVVCYVTLDITYVSYRQHMTRLDSIRPYLLYGSLYATAILAYSCYEVYLAYNPSYMWHPFTYCVRTLGTTGIQFTFLIHCFSSGKIRKYIFDRLKGKEQQTDDFDPFNELYRVISTESGTEKEEVNESSSTSGNSFENKLPQPVFLSKRSSNMVRKSMA